MIGSKKRLAITFCLLICLVVISVYFTIRNQETVIQDANFSIADTTVSPTFNSKIDSIVQVKTKNILNNVAIDKNGDIFEVPAGMGWLTVRVHNTGTSTLTVTVDRAKDNSNYLTYDVPAGKQLVIPNNGKATGVGIHIISFSSKNGLLSGSYSVTMANNPYKSSN